MKKMNLGFGAQGTKFRTTQTVSNTRRDKELPRLGVIIIGITRQA